MAVVPIIIIPVRVTMPVPVAMTAMSMTAMPMTAVAMTAVTTCPVTKALPGRSGRDIGEQGDREYFVLPRGCLGN